MYTTIIHPLRKAYNLSINEYCVLEAIRTLSNNTKYQGWCMMSQGRIADSLDLSREWVGKIYIALEAKTLIERRKSSREDTAVRTCDEWNEWFMADKADVMLAMRTGASELTTVQKRVDGSGSHPENKLHTPCELSSHPCEQTSHNTNIDIYKDTNISSKEESEACCSDEKEFGRKELNEMRKFILSELKAGDFKESQSWQRKHLQNLLSLKVRIGEVEFSRRLAATLDDPFKRKNSGSVAYIYREIKGFVGKPKPKRKVEPVWEPPV